MVMMSRGFIKVPGFAGGRRGALPPGPPGVFQQR